MSEVNNIHEIKFDTDVLKVLENAVEAAKNQEMDAALVIMIPRDGELIMNTSTCSGFQKAYMASFISAWIAKWHFGEAP